MQLLRLEAAQMAQIDRHAQISEVIDGVLTLLHERIEQQHITVITDFSPDELSVLVASASAATVVSGTARLSDRQCQPCQPRY
jgi:hypothetical protein